MLQPHFPVLVNITFTDIGLHCLLEFTWPCGDDVISACQIKSERIQLLVGYMLSKFDESVFTGLIIQHFFSTSYMITARLTSPILTYRWISKIRNANFAVTVTVFTKEQTKSIALCFEQTPITPNNHKI